MVDPYINMRSWEYVYFKTDYHLIYKENTDIFQLENSYNNNQIGYIFSLKVK